MEARYNAEKICTFACLSTGLLCCTILPDEQRRRFYFLISASKSCMPSMIASVRVPLIAFAHSSMRSSSFGVKRSPIRSVRDTSCFGGLPLQGGNVLTSFLHDHNTICTTKSQHAAKQFFKFFFIRERPPISGLFSFPVSVVGVGIGTRFRAAASD